MTRQKDYTLNSELVEELIASGLDGLPELLRVVGIFPNENSCLRLISAILMEISGDWQIGKRAFLASH